MVHPPRKISFTHVVFAIFSFPIYGHGHVLGLGKEYRETTPPLKRIKKSIVVFILVYFSTGTTFGDKDGGGLEWFTALLG